MQGGAELRRRAEKVADAFGERLQELPLAMPQMCCSLHLLGLDGGSAQSPSDSADGNGSQNHTGMRDRLTAGWPTIWSFLHGGIPPLCGNENDD